MSSFSNTHIAYQVHTCSHIQKNHTYTHSQRPAYRNVVQANISSDVPFGPPFLHPLSFPVFQSSCSEDLATDIQTHSYDSVTSQSSDLGRNYPGHGPTCRIHKHTQHTALPVPNPLQGVNDRPSSRSEINLKPQVKKGDRL